MEWMPVIVLGIVFIIIKFSGKDSDKVAADFGRSLAKISSVAEKSTQAYKEEKKKLKESVNEITKPITEVSDDIKTTMKGEE